MRVRHKLWKLALWALALTPLAFALAPYSALAQEVNITPPVSATAGPTGCKITGADVNCGAWTYWMALGAIVVGVLVLLGVVLAYLRYSPKFFGRAEAPKAPPPGARPESLVRQAAAVRAPTAAAQAAPPVPQAAQASAGTTATAIMDRPAPAQGPEEEPLAEAPEPGEGEPEEPPTAESEAPTADTQAAAEAEAPSAEAEPDAEAPAAEAEPNAEAPSAEAEPDAEAPAAAPEATPSTASQSGGAALDQETFDRVLQEQLAKGVDRRVAEGRARAAGIVAARKKAQG